MKRIVLILLVVTVFFSAGCRNVNRTIEKKTDITVSIPTLGYFLSGLAGDSINIHIAIPPGYNPVNHSPTPAEMEEISNSAMYFSVGVPAEKNVLLDRVINLNSDIKIVLLDEYVDSKAEPRYFNHSENEDDSHMHGHEGRDPHIWLSVKRAILIVEKMYDELKRLETVDNETLSKNKTDILQELNSLDKEIKSILDGHAGKTVIVYHPSIGYFTDDYGLNMMEIEEEGKEAFAKALIEIIDFAKKNNIKNILYQKEFDANKPEIIAGELGGKALAYRPLDYNYPEIMRELAYLIKEAANGEDSGS